ncbi:hypothetical protein R1sor_014517 [Riccia sorocarpa]|uniref:Uncharacterized protein n=1 Tax=Riccia sorocarpa TaxID=122646 RepID=A0ABD3HA48_9MARC
MSAIQDFTTLLCTNRARTPIPPPVDSEVFRQALETLDISVLFTPPTSVPASPAVPPPDLGMDLQPEPEVEPKIEPQEVQPEVHDQPEVQHIVELTASVKSHHPSTEVPALEMYPRRLREATKTGGMLRYESHPDPPVFEEDVISSEDEDFGGLQDEEDAMADLFT